MSFDQKLLESYPKLRYCPVQDISKFYKIKFDFSNININIEVYNIYIKKYRNGDRHFLWYREFANLINAIKSINVNVLEFVSTFQTKLKKHILQMKVPSSNYWYYMLISLIYLRNCFTSIYDKCGKVFMIAENYLRINQQVKKVLFLLSGTSIIGNNVRNLTKYIELVYPQIKECIEFVSVDSNSLLPDNHQIPSVLTTFRKRFVKKIENEIPLEPFNKKLEIKKDEEINTSFYTTKKENTFGNKKKRKNKFNLQKEQNTNDIVNHIMNNVTISSEHLSKNQRKKLNKQRLQEEINSNKKRMRMSC